jgi:hypothetical protein
MGTAKLSQTVCERPALPKRYRRWNRVSMFLLARAIKIKRQQRTGSGLRARAS